MPTVPILTRLLIASRISTASAALGLALFALPALPALANTVEEASQSLKAGDAAKALEQVNRFLANRPKDAQARFLKGLALTGLNKPNDAIAIFKKLTEDYPELPEPYNNLAVIYAQQKQYDKAKDALEKAIRTHPAYATAHENLGDIYSRLASQAYGKALQIDASNASAQTKLAMINDLVGAPVKVGAGGTAVATTTAAAPVPPPAPAASATPIVIAAAPAPSAPPPPKEVAAPKPSAPPIPPKPIEPVKPVENKPVPTKPAEVKAPAPVQTAKDQPDQPASGASGDVTAAVDSWLAAWSKKDVKTYLGHYAKDFQTPKGETRKAWETDRTQRVGKPGKIEVSRDDLSIKLDGNDKALVKFRQNYKSAGFKSSAGKTLVLIKRDGKWQIQQERVGG